MDNFTSGIKESVQKEYEAFLKKQENKRIVSKRHECLCGRACKISIAVPEKFSDEITSEAIVIEQIECDHSDEKRK